MNILRYIAILGICFFFTACSDKKQTLLETPKLLIEQDKMAEILSEVELIEAYLEQVPYSKRGNNDTDYVYYPLLFEKYKINKEDFLNNLAFYSKQENKISDIYDKALIRLNKLKSKDLELRLQMKMDSIHLDSIKNANR